MTIEKYRKIMKDKVSTDQQINMRIQYIESLCKKVINEEIENYLKKIKNDSI